MTDGEKQINNGGFNIHDVGRDLHLQSDGDMVGHDKHVGDCVAGNKIANNTNIYNQFNAPQSDLFEGVDQRNKGLLHLAIKAGGLMLLFSLTLFFFKIALPLAYIAAGVGIFLIGAVFLFVLASSRGLDNKRLSESTESLVRDHLIKQQAQLVQGQAA